MLRWITALPGHQADRGVLAMDRDQNLLFGVLAVQLENITATQFVHAAEAWAAHPSKPLATHLVEGGALSESDRDFVDAVLNRAVRNSGGTSEAALRQAGGDEAVRTASGGNITLVDSSGISIRTPLEPQPIAPEPGSVLDATASPAPQRTQIEELPWKQIGIICTGIILFLAFTGYGFWRVLQDKSEAERARLDAERALLVLERDQADADWEIGLAQEAQFAAEERQRVAERQREVAEAQKSIALESIMKLTREIPPRLINIPETHTVLREFLEENAVATERILELEPDSDELDREKAANYALMGSLWGSLGDTAKSIASHERALAITKRLAGASPEQTHLQRLLAQRFDEVGLAHSDANDYEEAVASFESSLDVHRALSDANPNDAALLPVMAKTYNNLANTHNSFGARAEAHAAYANALELNRNALLTASADGTVSEDELRDDALATYEKTVQIFQALMAAQPGDSTLSAELPLAYENIALQYGLQGRYEEAQRAFQQSLEFYRAASKADAPNGAIAASRARVYSHQGLVYGLLGDYEKSQDAHAKSFEIAQEFLTEDPDDTSLRQILTSNSFALGCVHLRFSEHEKARAEFTTMLEDYMHPSLLDPIAPAHADSIYPLYVQAYGLLSHAGRAEEALQLQGAYVTLQRYFADLDPGNADCLSTLAAECVKFGMALRRASRIDEARASFQSALDILIGLASKYPENPDFQSQIEPLRQRLSRIDEGR